jgi:mRNA interferase YafQ
MLSIKYHNQFKKDYKAALKKGYNKQLFQEIITLLAMEKTLPQKYRDHILNNSKKFKNMRECHIKPDLLLIYKIDREELCLSLIRTGSHSNLFN